MQARLLFLLAAASPLACSTGAGVRQMTYPPEFQYIAHHEVHAAMGQIANTTLALNNELRTSEQDDIDRDRVVQLLQRLERDLSDLGGHGRRTNHPLLDANLAAFRRDVALALQNAQTDPPNYFLAGSVGGACMYCHHAG